MQNAQCDNITITIHDDQDQSKKGKQPMVRTEQEEHDTLHFSGCYDDNCTTHQQAKDGEGWYPKKVQKQRHQYTSWRRCYDDNCADHYAWKKKGGYYPRRNGWHKDFTVKEWFEPGTWGRKEKAEGTQQADEGGDENPAWMAEGTQKKEQEDGWGSGAGTQKEQEDGWGSGTATGRETTPAKSELSELGDDVIEFLATHSGEPTPPAKDVEGLTMQLKAAREYIDYQRKEHYKKEEDLWKELHQLQEGFLKETTMRIILQMELTNMEVGIKRMRERLTRNIA